MSRILPILFNTEMVQAILDNRKTVTRRIIKPSFRPDESNFKVFINMGTKERWAEKIDEEEMSFDPPRYVIPPFQPGDILYIREKWAFQECNVCKQIDCHKTPITRCEDDVSVEGCYIFRAYHPHPKWITWKPSIHMPKAAARIWLRVTDIKIQRLQEITIEGIRSEGLSSMAVHAGDMEIATQEWKILWDSTIPKAQQALYGWAANPWVWVIAFERSAKPDPCILKEIAPAEDM